MPPRVQLLMKAPLNSWVVLSEDETAIVASGSTFEEAAAKAQERGVAEPIVIKTPEDWTPRVL